MEGIENGDDLPTPRSGMARRAPAAALEATEPGLDDLAVTLSLDELLPDANGEVVIVSVAGEPGLSIVTDERICESGLKGSHVTADGFDVGGFAFCAFESGKTLYYSPDLNLTIAQTDAR